MDLLEAIKARKSIRAYTSRKVPKNIIAEILNIASRAPSAMNTQPWEFAVITGDTLNKIRSSVIEKLNNKEPMQPDHLVVGWHKDGLQKSGRVISNFYMSLTVFLDWSGKMWTLKILSLRFVRHFD